MQRRVRVQATTPAASRHHWHCGPVCGPGWLPRARRRRSRRCRSAPLVHNFAVALRQAVPWGSALFILGKNCSVGPTNPTIRQQHVVSRILLIRQHALLSTVNIVRMHASPNTVIMVDRLPPKDEVSSDFVNFVFSPVVYFQENLIVFLLNLAT